MNRPIYTSQEETLSCPIYTSAGVGHVFKTVESGDVEAAEKMLATRTGLEAKYLRNTIREKAHLRTEWNKQRLSIMYSLIAIKFRDARLRKWLLNTQ